MQTMVSYAVKAIRACKRKDGIRAIDAKSDVQRDYVAKVKRRLKSTVWQTGGCTAFYRKNMTGEVTSLSPESVVQFIFPRQRVRLGDYHLIE
jgi:hypothetical protein